MSLENISSGIEAKKPTLYVVCKLTGASVDHIDSIATIIRQLNSWFDVLPFQYDFGSYRPTGAREDVLELDLQKVEQAKFMVVILMGSGEASDGRGMEVMHRMHQSDEHIRKTLILHRDPIESISPMFVGLPRRYTGVALKKFDVLSRVAPLVHSWSKIV